MNKRSALKHWRKAGTEWVKNSAVCFRCLSKTNHVASNCPHTGSRAMHHLRGIERRVTLFHKDKTSKAEQARTSITSKCTTACGDNQGGASWGKIPGLVNLCRKEDPSQVHHVYVIIEEQSNV